MMRDSFPEIERARSALFSLDPSTDRDTWVRHGMSAKAAGLDFDDFHNWSAGAGNYQSEGECRTVWNSFKPGNVTAATLFRSALATGWTDENGTKGKNASRPSASIAKPAPSPAKPVKQGANMSAADIWARCVPATIADPYIDRKRGKPDGLRVYPVGAPPLIIRGENVGGYLAVPCWSGEQLQTLQFIPQDKGDKLNLPGASFNDGFFPVGTVTDRAYICEGLGQAWAVNQATGAGAVVCFGAGRMATVAKALRTQFPVARLVIVPDKGKETDAAKIAADVCGQIAAMPADKPSNYDASDFAQEFGIGALSDLLSRAHAAEMRFKLLSGADICNAPPMRWLVRGVLPMDGLAALYGASGSGKSFLMLDIAAAVAGDASNWFGRRLAHVPVTYVCLEGEAGMGKRVRAWSLHHSKPVPDALRFVTRTFDLLSDDVPELAKAIVAGGGGGLVILDTLNRAAPGADENSSVDMGHLIAAAKSLQNLVGGLVILVHHTGKDASKGLRGHSSLYAALDGAIEVVKVDKRHEWSVAKSKDDITGDSHPFKLEITRVGIDDNHDEITSCVVLPATGVNDEIRQKLPPKSGNQRLIWDALGGLLGASRERGKGGAPTESPCVLFDYAIEQTRGRLPCEAKRHTERAQAAISGLVTRGLLVLRDGWLWAA